MSTNPQQDADDILREIAELQAKIAQESASLENLEGIYAQLQPYLKDGTTTVGEAKKLWARDHATKKGGKSL